MKRRLVVALLTLACMAVTSVIVTGCAYRRADRSLVQPLAFSKKQFTGEWYYMKTVYEAPYESGYFSGQGGWPLGSKIRFEVTERYLYAFNASPNVRNTASAVTPVAAWPISRHFDIKPRLNYSTGEPSNVIVEESFDGIPWYQRKYMRVHWERSLITDLTSLGETLTKWFYRGMFYDEAARYAPPEKVEIQQDYMGFVVDRIVTHKWRSLINMFYSEIPASSFRVRMRHSFKRVPVNSTYTPKEYNDFMLSKFGNFRTGIVRFQPDRGLVDWSYKFYANRHNVASGDDLKKDPNTTKPKKIIYYLSPNFPTDLRDAAIQVGNDWNAAMAYALQRDAKENGVNAVYEVLPNAWVEGVCSRDKMWECTYEKTKKKREIGDLRHNILWYVNNPQTGSPLGYGPSFADPDTGEIVNAMAYVYGAGFRTIVEQYMVLFDLMSGRYKTDDVINGTEYFNAIFGLNGHSHLLGTPSTSTTKQQPNSTGIGAGSKVTGPQLRLNTMNKMIQRVRSAAFLTRMQNTLKLDQTTITSQLARFDSNPKAKAYMMSDFTARLAFPLADPAFALTSTNPAIKARLKLYHPSEWAKPHNLNKLLREYMVPSKFNMYMANYADPILDSFVQWHVRKGTPRDEVRKDMLRFMFIAVTAHEVGHTLGLMHNFRGSTDEFNYHNAYHDLKEGKTPKNCYIDGAPCDPSKIDPTLKDPYNKDKNGKPQPAAMGWYRNASIMDYAGQMYDDHLGVGKTDRAALAFIYGGVVETAVKDPREQGKLIKWDMKVEARNADPKDQLKLRHFRYCSDYAIGQDPFCMVWDAGPTAEGIVNQIILNYDRSYPLRYWRRGRRLFGPGYAVGRMMFTFRQIALFHQDLSYRITTQPGYEKTEDFKDKLKATQTGFSFFMRILTTPRMGLHEYDQLDGIYKLSAIDEDATKPKIDVKLGEGRYFFSDIADDYFGVARFRFRRIGSLYDKWITMMMLSARSWGYYNNNINWLYTNFYDLFTKDTTEFFSQGLSDIWDKNSNLLFRKTDGTNPQPLEPGWHPILQYNGMMYALALLNNPFHDRTFGNNMMVGLKGSGKSWTPPGMGQVKCPPMNTFTKQFQCGDTNTPLVCFNNFLNTRTYFAVQPKNEMGISFKLVQRACNLSNQLAVLRKQGARRTFIERKENELELIETVLTIMQLYSTIFQG